MTTQSQGTSVEGYVRDRRTGLLTQVDDTRLGEYRERVAKKREMDSLRDEVGRLRGMVERLLGLTTDV